MLALLLLSACSSKKSKQTDEPLKVKTYTVAESTIAGSRSYVGTIEESEGSMAELRRYGNGKADIS